MTAPTIGLALIARDEEANLPFLLASVGGCFDQVVLLDTGSTDRTVEVFEAWALSQDLALGHRVGRFEWCDDFAAARNAADALLDTDWLVDADADDEIRGADRIREVAAVAASTPACVGASFVYDYDRHAEGQPGDTHERWRLARRGASKWAGRVHETRVCNEGGRGDIGVLTEVCCWVHRRKPGPANCRRNLLVARRWARSGTGKPASAERVHG